MHQILNRTCRILPALFVLALASAMGISGCRPPGERQLIYDSVKNHIISLQEAVMFTSKFRGTVDSLDVKCPDFKSSFQIGRAEAFNRYSYDFLLAQKDSLGRPAAGIRTYYGIDSNNAIKLVMVPYDVDGNDILHHLGLVDDKQTPGASPAHTEALTVNTAQAFEVGVLCPPNCPPQSPLNEK